MTLNEELATYGAANTALAVHLCIGLQDPGMHEPLLWRYTGFHLLFQSLLRRGYTVSCTTVDTESHGRLFSVSVITAGKDNQDGYLRQDVWGADLFLTLFVAACKILGIQPRGLSPSTAHGTTN